ncbi:MAG: hypothetical protein QXE57_02060 [Nitrososphaerales archaeon]
MSFELGTTVRLKIVSKDFSGELTDVDEPPKISVWDASKAKRVDSQSSVKEQTGTYHFDLTLDESWGTGVWLYEVRASIAGKPLVARGSLRVVKTE